MPDFDSLNISGNLTVNGNLIIRQPHEAAHAGYARNFGDNRSAATTDTWNDVPDRSVTYNVKRNNSTLWITIDDSFGTQQTGNAPSLMLRLLMDGSQVGGTKSSHAGGSYSWRIWSGYTGWIIPNVSAGSHTFKLQWLRYSGGTDNLLMGWSVQHNFMLVRELY